MLVGPVRGALAGEADFSGKVYFFQGARYWRYDLNKDYGEVDYPQPLGIWKLPREFDSGVDACLSGRGKYEGKAYFFKDRWYVSYDWKTKRIGDLQSITTWDRERAFPFPNGFDAALNGKDAKGKKLSRYAYFFKADKYARYDWDTDRFDLVNQKLSAWHLGDGFDSHITACLSADNDKILSNPTSYFFKGDTYVKYDWQEDRAVPGYPMPIAAGWPSGCGVWASHSKAPTNVCSDPRLDKGKARIAYPYGTLSGQAGWQVLVKFKTIRELADALQQLIIPDFYGDDKAGKGYVPRGRITRLGLNAHGLPGLYEANGENNPNSSDWSFKLNDTNVLQMVKDKGVREHLEQILPMLAPGASVLLLGCQAGQDITGGNFVMAFSEILRDHPVTAFTSIGYAGGPHTMRDKTCYEAGMRDSGFMRSSRSAQEENERVAKYWGNLEEWPWAFEHSPSAKTALNGKIIRPPINDYQLKPTSK